MRLKTIFPKLDQVGPIVQSRIYYRRGVQVDLVKTKFNQEHELNEILVAIKRNVQGFWDESIQDFIPEPKYLNFPGQESNLRHSQAVFANEKKVLFDILNIPELFKYAPLLFETDTASVATEFIKGELLEHEIEGGKLLASDKLRVILQMIHYIYLMHKNKLYHNDFHGRNILVTSTRQIKVIDYSMAGDRNDGLSYEWSDIGRLNQYILRVLTSNIQEVGRSLSSEELKMTNDLGSLLKHLPFKEESFLALIG